LREICVVGVAHDELDMLTSMTAAETSIIDGDEIF
jgi:hypothetical protein